jgi:hypothetical protein
MHLTKSSRRKSNDKICSLLSIRQAFKKVTAQQKDQMAKIEGEQIPSIVQSVSETNMKAKNIWALPGINCINQIQSPGRASVSYIDHI